MKKTKKTIEKKLNYRIRKKQSFPKIMEPKKSTSFCLKKAKKTNPRNKNNFAFKQI